MKKILVIYFSRTGFTNGIAEKIAQQCYADIESIKIRHNFGNRHAIVADRDQWQKNGYLKSMYQAITHATPRIEHIKPNLDHYDFIIIGTPIWFWNIASPVRTLLTRYDFHQKTVALFCTYGGSGAGKVFHDMEKILNKKSVARVAITNAEILNHQYDEKVAKFVSAITENETVPQQASSLA